MRTVIWSNAFTRSFKRWMRKRPDLHNDIAEALKLLNNLGFSMRTKGDHHIFYREGIEEIVNLQPLKDGKAKAYQVRQVREIIHKYKLHGVV